MSNAEVFSSKEDFRSQAKTMQGSADFGAQLFCTLLRSASIDARLVCSLQPLPFAGILKGMTPSKPKSKEIVVSSDLNDTPMNDPEKSPASPTPARTQRIGRPAFRPAPTRPNVHSGMLHQFSIRLYSIIVVLIFSKVPCQPQKYHHTRYSGSRLSMKAPRNGLPLIR